MSLSDELSKSSDVESWSCELNKSGSLVSTPNSFKSPETSFANEVSGDLKEFGVDTNEPDLFNSHDQDSTSDDLLSSSESDNEEDDLEIPAFLRRQKN